MITVLYINSVDNKVETSTSSSAHCQQASELPAFRSAKLWAQVKRQGPVHPLYISLLFNEPVKSVRVDVYRIVHAYIALYRASDEKQSENRLSSFPESRDKRTAHAWKLHSTHSFLKREAYWLWLNAEYRSTTVTGNQKQEQPWYDWMNTVWTECTKFKAASRWFVQVIPESDFPRLCWPRFR